MGTQDPTTIERELFSKTEVTKVSIVCLGFGVLFRLDPRLGFRDYIVLSSISGDPTDRDL